MEVRAWRLAGGCAVALLVLAGLVAWRADSLAGGWLLALRVTGALAVLGLLAAVVLAGLVALRPPTAPAVVVRVPTSGAPETRTQPGRAALVPLTAVLMLGVLSSAPALVVLVLATAPREQQPVADDDGAPATATTSPGAPEGSAAPETSAPPETSPPSEQAGEQPSEQPSEQPGAVETPAQQVSPSQLPTAGGLAGCEQVVVRGDSLWSLAAAQLGPGAGDADVDARWRALYERNAEAVGPDPDLLLPGLALRTCA